MPKNTDQIEQMIYNAHRAGVCDIDGHSITVNGRPTKPPRTYSRSSAVSFRYDKDKMQLVEVKDGE